MGAQHDMRLAKKHLAELYPYKIVIADRGYQGLAKTGLQTPKKKSKHHPLNKQDKEANRWLGKLRTVIEHINRKLKIFKILSLPSRNRRKRFGALILAGAGSGKTRVLTTRIAWLLQTGQVSPGGVLAVTFTNKAAREMQARLAAMLPLNARGMWMGTFHGLANRLLRTHWKAAGLPQSFQEIGRAHV